MERKNHLFSSKHLEICTSLEGKAGAFPLALYVAISQKRNKVFWLSDSLMLTEAIRHGLDVPWEIATVVENIRPKVKLFLLLVCKWND